MELRNIYQPIEKELKSMEEVLEISLKESKNQSILSMGSYLLESPGKRIRPALVILSSKASLGYRSQTSSRKLIKIASAIELIHMASLIHDDVIDHSYLRHNKPTINSKWGEDISIALGDYLYSIAFELISDCDNSDITHCINTATKAMCEGELLQVCERDNLSLSREKYIFIVKKKTASLFAASCQAGGLISESHQPLQNALREYGLNFGIAFQIIDDYLDLVGEKDVTGKIPGQDIKSGEITLPLLNLLESVSKNEREDLRALLTHKRDKAALEKIKLMIVSSGAAYKTKKLASSYMILAKKNLDKLSSSPFKISLNNLADYMAGESFHNIEI